VSLPGAHRGAADPRQAHKDLAEWGGMAVTAGLAVWLFFGLLDPVTRELERSWGGHPLVLVVAGWLPVGGFLCAGAAVALRHERLRRRGRAMRWIEKTVYGCVGVGWFTLVTLMLGKQARYGPYDPIRVADRVAQNCVAFALGVLAGALAFARGIWLALAFVVAWVVRLPRPGWPFEWTLASWLLGGAALSLVATFVFVAATT
jgi:hypothetical protein